MKEGSLGIQQMHCRTHVQDALLRGNVKAKSETKKKKAGSQYWGKKTKTKVQKKQKKNKTKQEPCGKFLRKGYCCHNTHHNADMRQKMNQELE